MNIITLRVMMFHATRYFADRPPREGCEWWRLPLGSRQMRMEWVAVIRPIADRSHATNSPTAPVADTVFRRREVRTVPNSAPHA